MRRRILDWQQKQTPNLDIGHNEKNGILRKGETQKKLCGEEDCKRCGNFDVKEPCLEIEQVRKNKGWMCPHCIEAKEINPHWICNR
ncbi:hypothetical protein JHK86_018151 [Glycine max]|nr:hypothetical protein JHK86_018151 [Glycine max]